LKLCGIIALGTFDVINVPLWCMSFKFNLFTTSFYIVSSVGKAFKMSTTFSSVEIFIKFPSNW
jgi:hypothetical protein